MGSSGFSRRSGCADVRFLANVRVLDLDDLCCNISSVFNSVRVFSVENLWRSLGESLLKSCGKVSTVWQKWEFCTQNCGSGSVFHVLVEKFCHEFSTLINRGGWAVLHSFHRVYYNYYYYIRKFGGGTAKKYARFESANT